MSASLVDQKSRTKIVATIGPATRSAERIAELVRAGVDVIRLNFSHGTIDEHRTVIARARAVAAEMRRHIAVMQDLQGPKIRVGGLTGGGPVHLLPESRVVITTTPVVGTAERFSTTYEGLPRDVKPGDRLLLADGALELEVDAVRDGEVAAVVRRGGMLGEHQGINLPGVAVSAPVLTEKDLADLQVGLGLDVDFVALSFVRRAEDMRWAREQVRRLGRDVPLIAKLERPEAITNLDAIVRESDGVMVARGDLGVELPPERIPVLQKTIIARANAAGVPVITATQMLESMTLHPRPTRAETSDVANAILDGTDAVMLSGETAVGQYPIEAVRMMDRIAKEVEAESLDRRRAARYDVGHASSVARAAAQIAGEVHARAIAVVTRSGRTAQLLSLLRPHEPVVAFTEDTAVARRLALWWGVWPIVIPFRNSTDEMVAAVERALLAEGLVEEGELVVLVGSAPVIARGRTNFVKLHRLPRARAARGLEGRSPDRERESRRTSPGRPEL